MTKISPERSDAAITIVSKEHISYRTKPRNLKTEDLSLFSHELEKKIFKTHILTLKDCWVVNELIFSLKDPGFYTSYTFPHQLKEKIRSMALKLYLIGKYIRAAFFLFNKQEKISSAVWITDRRSKEYFHWFTDALPRLIAAKDFIKLHTLILPEYYQNIPYIKDSLTFFSVPVRFVRPTARLEVGELILPGHTADPGNYNRSLIIKLRDTFLYNYKEDNRRAYRKIYISREKAKKRKISNEDGVVKLLLTYGFEIHYFEDYCLEKQIQICAQAKTIVGLHGAGLTNILFMPEKGQVLELRNESDSHNNCFFSLASELNLEYYYQLNKGNKRRTYRVTVFVNLNDLRKNLEIMGMVPLSN